MDENKRRFEPDNTAVRTALWRALHVQIDAKPHVLEDEIGLKLIAPNEGWQERPDMKFTPRLRASIVARARFIEDLIKEQSEKGINQYVMLGAGLDSFAQRNPAIASNLHIYEIDQAYTLLWKQQKLEELGFNIPENLHFVSVDFENFSWWDELLQSGFNINEPAVVACTGVTLYLTKETIVDTLNLLSKLATGSKLAITFYLPIELLDKEDQPMQAIAEKGALASGTPFISFFTTNEILALGKNAGFKDVKTIATNDMIELYFKNRTDRLIPASGEVFLLATT